MPLQHNDRSEFQLERAILFTDAVFAIAITLLIIEIKVPELHHPSEHAAQQGLASLTARFIGFFLGFFIIAIYWLAHHRIFRFVQRTTPGLLWLNMLFLLSIVLMPFTTAFQSEYGMLATPWVAYSINIMATGLLQTLLQRYIRNPANGVATPDAYTHPDLDYVRPLLTPAVFALSIGLAMLPVHPSLLRLMPILLFILMPLQRRRLARLLAAHEARRAV